MTTDLFALQGKTALITGASSGIGARMSLALAAAGANVLLLARREDALLEQIGKIEARCPSVTAKMLVADLNHCTDWHALAASIYARFTSIDILCNVAGVNLRQPWDEISSESWDETLNLNLKVPFFLARALLPKMQENTWGKIINIASLQSSRAFPDSIPYGASKGGVPQLTRAMAEAWSRYNIGVNAIAPGFFPTELTAPVFNDTVRAQKLAEQTACKRNGKLEDMDGISVFLASEASDYITGQTIHIDGGFTAS